MQLHTPYYWFKSVISPEDCRRIIEIGTKKIAEAKANGQNTSAYTFGERQKDGMPSATPQGELTTQQLKQQGVNTSSTYVRDSDVAWLDDQWIYDLVLPLVKEANAKAGWDWQFDTAEMFQFTVYKPGGFYSWHKDGFSDRFGAYKRWIYGITSKPLKPDGRLPDRYVIHESMIGKIRKISLTINLNEPGEYDGGNLKFDFGQHTEGEQFWEVKEIRPQGSMVVFPSFTDHTVTPVTRGTRYSLVLWCLGDPFK
jgi:PKHD-type hydroxylase